jgi:uncharacterized protein
VCHHHRPEAKRERGDVYIVELAALLRDISDDKLNGGDHQRGPRHAAEWIRDVGVSETPAAAVAEVIAGPSSPSS